MHCKNCGIARPYISKSLELCVLCIRDRFHECLPAISETHKTNRRNFNLACEVPRTAGGLTCERCFNLCVMGAGKKGYCGLRSNENGRLVSLSTHNSALMHYYLDPHITNCCNSWFCPASTGNGYPKYAVKNRCERGYYNLSIFFYGCNFNCLFCQNWSHKYISEGTRVSAQELVDFTLSDKRITCWCFFGGGPEPQLPFALNASREVLESKDSERVMRICFEWNGTGNTGLVHETAELSLKSGGNIKFDLKAHSKELSIALSGADNSKAFENFEYVYKEFWSKRSDVPVLAATTLLVSGYVDEHEVGSIARFIAGLNPEIPYSLLVFHPDFAMRDLPVTPIRQVDACVAAAKKYLKNVRLGNKHLLAMAPLE